MSKINNNGKKSKFKKENKNKDTNEFYDVLSIPSNPEDLFTLQCSIGHGAFGSVYKAIHNSTKKTYAIKIIDYSKGNNKENNNVIKYNYFSIQQEASLMRLINDSNYIVKYYGSYFSRNSNTLWLILEYCSSGSASDLMMSMERTFSEVEVATIMEMVLQGLILIHSKKLIHRDIKAANILLSEDGYAKLGDFGVGAQLSDEQFRKSKKGSPYWMSPQVVSNMNYDFKTDIWSLGITCVELLEGEPPFSNLKPQIIMEKLSKKPPTVDEMIDFNEHTNELRSFLEHCLEIDPKKRFSAEELLKHEFIKKFSKGRKYLIELIKKHLNDIKKYRIESEEEYQKLMKKKENINKDESLNTDEITEEKIFFSKTNVYNEFFQEQINDNLDSIDCKIQKFLKNIKKKENNNNNNDNDEEKINKNSINEEKEKIIDNKSFEVFKSIIISDDISSTDQDKQVKENKNNIIIDKNINKENKDKKCDYNFKIIKNYELEIDSNKNLIDNKEKNNKDKNSTVFETEKNNSSPNVTTDENSKKSGSNIILDIKEKKKNNFSIRDSYNIFFNDIDDELNNQREKRPFEFQIKSNDINYIDNINNKDKIDENINDSDDEYTLNIANNYNNIFKNADKYQNNKREKI